MPWWRQQSSAPDRCADGTGRSPGLHPTHVLGILGIARLHADRGYGGGNSLNPDIPSSPLLDLVSRQAYKGWAGDPGDSRTVNEHKKSGSNSYRLPAPTKHRLAIAAHANCALCPFFRRIVIALRRSKSRKWDVNGRLALMLFDSPAGYRPDTYRTCSSLRMKK